LRTSTPIAPALGLDPTYPFPLQRITLQTPAGTPGPADIKLTSPAGAATSSSAFQYLQSVQTYANPGLYKFLLYDQQRQFIYLSATDHISIFDLKAGAFRTGLSIYCPSKNSPGPCPDADLRGMALTPDGSQLIVADWGSSNIYLLDPDSPGTVSFVPVSVPGYGPARIAATSTQKIFIALQSIAGASAACSSCLTQLDLTASPPAVLPAPQPEVSTLAGSPLLQADAAGDKVFLAFDAAHGGPVSFWTATSPNDFTMLPVNQAPSDVAISADGSTFATVSNNTTEIRDSNLSLITVQGVAELEKIPTRTLVPGIALNATGTRLYQPWLNAPAPPMPSSTATRAGIDILDTQTGRLLLRIQQPEPLAALSTDTTALQAQFLTTDETGKRIFALTTSGLTILQLAALP